MKYNQRAAENRRRTLSAFGALGALALASLWGCGSKPLVDENRSGISGTVTFAGKPLKAGTITFDSIEKKGLSTAVSIGSDGRYSTNRVPVGKNAVTIETESLQYGSPHLYTKIPVKYADSALSGLEVDVQSGTNDKFDFELKP